MPKHWCPLTPPPPNLQKHPYIKLLGDEPTEWLIMRGDYFIQILVKNITFNTNNVSFIILESFWKSLFVVVWTSNCIQVFFLNTTTRCHSVCTKNINVAHLFLIKKKKSMAFKIKNKRCCKLNVTQVDPRAPLDRQNTLWGNWGHLEGIVQVISWLTNV